MTDKVAISYAGEIKVSHGALPFPLYAHQEDAIKSLDDKVLHSKSPHFAGLLVIPTGGGKTLVAVRWLLENVIDQNKKVLWIAHRHQLLEQAFGTVIDSAYSSLLPNRTSFRYRIISGQHDKPVHIQPEDDIIIASKDSLNRDTAMNYLLNHWLKHTDEVLLVIDEAHHAVAKTYRRIVKAIEDANGKKGTVRILGLTATPFRTAEAEKGLLGKVFRDKIVYKTDLRTLIGQGILAQPIFEELKTQLGVRDLTDKDIRDIQAFDGLPEHIARQIAENNERNKGIVTYYMHSFDAHRKSKYGQLLVFAVNIAHAYALNVLFNDELNKLFRTKGEKYSECVTGSVVDAITGVQIASKENKLKIDRFREGKTRVLVSVMILTEGVDLPKLQTVFLTRPTTSAIMMTQMIGRALRGKKAGGKEKAYIVSFIDDWQDKINWVNPETVIGDTGGYLWPGSKEAGKQVIQLISIAKMEEFARMMDRQVPALERIPFVERIPVGIYSFSILLPPKNGDEPEKDCEVLVYNHLFPAYRDFINDLKVLFAEAGHADKDNLTDDELEDLFERATAKYFSGYDLLLGYYDEDIRDILRFYAEQVEAPVFLEFKDRAKCDLAKEAKHIFDHSLGGKAKVDYQNSLWDDENSFWQVLFGHNKAYFIRQLHIEIEKLEDPDSFARKVEPALVTDDMRPIAELSLAEMREKAPPEWRKLREQVFAKHTDATGVIICAKSGFKSKYKIHFQIDHIKPMEKGGLSTLGNLQVLERSAHRKKHAGKVVSDGSDVESLTVPQTEVKAFCVRCKDWRPMLDPQQVVTANGHARLKGTCLKCGTQMSKFVKEK